MAEKQRYFPEHRHILIENRWPDFQNLLFNYGWSAINVQRVKEGYSIAQSAFYGQLRKSGQDWMFNHGEKISKNLVVEWGYKDPVAVISALNHDTVEDTFVFEPPRNEFMEEISDETNTPHLWPTNSQKREFAKARMRKLFDKDTARIVLVLTRPFIDQVEVWSYEQAQTMYVRQIAEAKDMRALVIKLEDNINNLEEPFDQEAHKLKKQQIKRDFLPIYKRLLTDRYKLEVAQRRLLRLNELLKED